MKIVNATKLIEAIMCKYTITRSITDLYYRMIVENEILVGRIKEGDRVLCIGGGPYPSTAINICRKTNANITVIDNDLECVKISRNVIKKLGLEHKIKVIHSDINNLCINRFSVVHVALQVTPKEKVIHEVMSRATCDTRVLLRMPKERLESLYDNLESGYKKECKSIVHPIYCNTKRTVLIVKEHSNILTDKEAELISLAV